MIFFLHRGHTVRSTESTQCSCIELEKKYIFNSGSARQEARVELQPVPGGRPGCGQRIHQPRPRAVSHCGHPRMQLARVRICTVPYDGENFANSKMDIFSLIIDWLNFLKNDWNFFMSMINKKVYLEVKAKKLFKAKTTIEKHRPSIKVPLTPIFKALCVCAVPTSQAFG